MTTIKYYAINYTTIKNKLNREEFASSYTKEEILARAKELAKENLFVDVYEQTYNEKKDKLSQYHLIAQMGLAID